MSLSGPSSNHTESIINNEHNHQMDAIAHALQTNNVQSALEMFQILLQQNKSMSHKLHKINHEITSIKAYSDELSNKLHHSSSHSLMQIAENIQCSASNIVSLCHTDTHNNEEHTLLNGHSHSINEHDLSLIVNGLESSDNKTDFYDDSVSIKTESITFVTDEHMDTVHERRGSHSNFSQKFLPKNTSSDDNQSIVSTSNTKQEMIKKLESGGRIFALIEKSETKRISKQKMIEFLQKKGVSQTKIEEAYTAYYDEHNLFQMIVHSHPLPFALSADEKGRNAIVSSIKPLSTTATNVKLNSHLYEVNGKRVDGRKHEKILRIVNAQNCPFYVVLQQKEQQNIALPKILHEHSTISSITQKNDFFDVVDIDWEQIGQILLDHRFLATAKLINHALDHLVCFS